MHKITTAAVAGVLLVPAATSTAVRRRVATPRR